MAAVTGLMSASAVYVVAAFGWLSIVAVLLAVNVALCRIERWRRADSPAATDPAANAGSGVLVDGDPDTSRHSRTPALAAS